MKFKYSLFLIVLLNTGDLFSQSTYTLRGVIRDAKTQEPMPFATVFFAGTTIGTTTNEKGGYLLRVESKGTYDLIVKFIGYETYAAQVVLGSMNVSRLNIEIKPGTIDLGSVEVVANRGGKWRKYMKEFERIFLGASANGINAEILNKEAIDFSYDEGEDKLTAFSNEPIEIDNPELGYLVKFYLEDFVIDYDDNISGYYGYSSFKELEPKGERKAKVWEKNRTSAFRGSTTHFFKSLYENSLEEEGFVIRLTNVPTYDTKALSTQQEILDLLIKPDSTNEYKRLEYEGYLNVVYLNESEPINYKKPGLVSPRRRRAVDLPANIQESWILLLDGYSSVDFEPSGYVRNGTAIYTYGYLSFERVADLVPLDFKPGSK